MGDLYFVGMGLGDERDLSRRAIDRLRICEPIFAEEYTAVLAPGSLDRLSTEIGRPIIRLDRAALEAERQVLDALASPGRIAALLVVGDPFAATTHVALRIALEKVGHRWHYLPNASIVTAAPSYLGLMQYRFGRTVSLPFPEPGFEPRSPLEAIARNRAHGLHTLVLLDLRPGEGRFLTADRALTVYRSLDRDREVLPESLEIAVVARIGTESAQAWYGTVGQLREIDFGPPMHALVVPSRDLHFEEAEALERFRVRPRG